MHTLSIRIGCLLLWLAISFFVLTSSHYLWGPMFLKFSYNLVVFVGALCHHWNAPPYFSMPRGPCSKEFWRSAHSYYCRFKKSIPKSGVLLGSIFSQWHTWEIGRLFTCGSLPRSYRLLFRSELKKENIVGTTNCHQSLLNSGPQSPQHSFRCSFLGQLWLQSLTLYFVTHYTMYRRFYSYLAVWKSRIEFQWLNFSV